MKTTLRVVLTILVGSLMACTPAPAPSPNTPQRQAEPPPPPPRRDAPRRATKPPARQPPQCLLRSKDKSLCLRLVKKGTPPGCANMFCRNPREYRVVKLDGTLVHKLPARAMGKAIYLSNAGVVLFDLRHAITAPRAVVLTVNGPNKHYILKASDLLAPSRFLTDQNHPKTIAKGAVSIAVPGGKAPTFDFETQTVKHPDVHCQPFGKRHVVLSRSIFQQVGTFTVGRGTCPKHRALWSMSSTEAPVALTKNARRVVTRNSLLSQGGRRHIATVYQRKGNKGVVKARLGLRDLTTVKERLTPESCKGARCRASISYTFTLGGKLQLSFPWGGSKTLNLTRPALLRKKRTPWRYGVDKRTKRAFMGDPRAKVTLLVYGGLQCPYTGMLLQTLRDLLTVQRRGLKVVFADYPIRYHRQAIPAAVAARSVLAQKGPRAYWRFADEVIGNRRDVTSEKLQAWAKAVGADPAKVKADLQSNKYVAAVKADAARGKQLGVRGTPTLFINGKRASHRSFWAVRNQLKPLLGRRLKPVR